MDFSAAIRSREQRALPAGIVIFGILCLTYYGPVQAQTRPVEDRSAPPVSVQYVTQVVQGESAHYRMHLQVRHMDEKESHFLLPRWAPGYYRIMVWHQSISDVRAESADGTPLTIEQTGDNSWTVVNGPVRDFTFSYSVDAQVSVREGIPTALTRHYLHELGGLISGPRSWMYLDGHTSHRILIRFGLPDGWVVATGLNPTPDPNVFWAEDYDWLIDCPTLVGDASNLHLWRFSSWGVPFTVAYDGAGRGVTFDYGAFVESLKRICDCQAAIFGGFPFEHYTFLYYNGGGGGLEHLRSTTIGMNASGLERDPLSLWNISAHEFFHLWNVKRIRPKVLGPFDYRETNRTQSLWISEGITETYTAFTGIRAGFWTPQEYYDNFARSIAGWMGSPAQPYAPPARMSWTTWDGRERNPHGTISYYTQGEVLGMALDLIIREASDNQRSLDDVMRILMWEFGGEYLEKEGFGTEDFIYVCEDVAGLDLYDFFEDHVLGTKKPDWAKYLSYAGLTYLESEVEVVQPGLRCFDSPEGPIVRMVTEGSAPARAGIIRGDRVISIEGIEVSTAQEVNRQLSGMEEGSRVTIIVEREGESHNLTWRVETVRELRIAIGESPDATPEQLRVRRGFLTGVVDR